MRSTRWGRWFISGLFVVVVVVVAVVVEVVLPRFFFRWPERSQGRPQTGATETTP